MSVPCVVLKTLGGVTLQDPSARYTSALAPVQVRVQTAPSQIQTVPRSGMGPAYQGRILGERTITVVHMVAGDGATHEVNLQLLKHDHYSTTFGQRQLIFTDTDGIDKEVQVVAMRLVPIERIEQTAVNAEWTLLDPVAYDDAPSATTAVAKTASPATLAVANQGNEFSRKWVLTMKPTALRAPADGQLYRIKITPINRNPRPIVNWPVDLTDRQGAASWDHKAEVTASRSQADGDDVEVYVNGRRVDRWAWPSGAGTWNSDTTNVWCNLDMPAERHWTYRGNAVLAVGDTVVRVQEDIINMPRTPFYAAFVTANEATVEVVRVTGYDEDAHTLTIARAQRGTSAATWASGLRLYWTPVLIDLIYGGTSLPAPFTDDGCKPMILESVGGALSDNSVFYWLEYMESTEAAMVNSRRPRSAAWRPRMISPDFGRDDMKFNYIPRTASLTTDAAVATIMALAYRDAGALGGHPLSDTWELVSPIGITSVTHTYVVTTLNFDTDHEANLLITGIDGDGNEEHLADHDATNNTETLTPTANIYAVRFRAQPFDPKKDSTTVEIMAGKPTDADGWTVDAVHTHFDADEQILLTWGARGDAYQFGRPGAPATVADAFGTKLELNGTIVDLNETLSVDMDAQTATLSGDGTMVSHTLSGVFWPLPSGTNNLTYTDAGIGTVEIGVSSKQGAWT